MRIDWGSRTRLIGATAFVLISISPVAPEPGIHDHQVLPDYKFNYSYLTPVPGEIEIPEIPGVGGRIHVAPRRIYIRKQIGEPLLRARELIPEEVIELPEVTEVTIEGKPYLVIAGPEPTPHEAVMALPKHELREKIAAVRGALRVTQKQAVKYLEAVAQKEIKEGREMKAAFFANDEDLALIIILSEV
jgi:hypothetical protein